MLTLLRFWTKFEATVTPRDYRVHGLTLILLKYAGDAGLVAVATGRWWTLFDYFRRLPSVMATAADWPAWLMPALAAWSLPFVWIGVTLTARRAYDAGWSPWWAIVFFLPFANYVLMLILCLVPTASQRPPLLALGAAGPRQLRALLVSAAAGASIGAAMAWLAMVSGGYGLALFVGTPFTMGAITGFAYNRLHPAGIGPTIRATLLMLLMAAGLTLIVAAEGLICILMASPLIVALALMGGQMGREIALRCGRQLPPAFLAVLALPISSALEPPGSTGLVLHEVRSAVYIAAPAEQVWPHVIAFSPITGRPDLIFRLGIAEPLSARIEGTGIGATRYCTFSTGAFVEPITAWEPGRRLAFDVTSSPDQLRELSLYANVSPPHLHGYLRSQRGEFRLVPLPDKTTRLEGSTWYELDMAPEGYWQAWSDYIIHSIHRRVLAHVKDEVERGLQR